jgi:hypothetical protein
MSVEVIELLSDDEDTDASQKLTQRLGEDKESDIIDLCSPAKSSPKKRPSRSDALLDDEVSVSVTLISPSASLQHPKRPRVSPDSSAHTPEPSVSAQLDGNGNVFAAPSGWVPVPPEEVGGKLYPDRRWSYVRHLATVAKKLRGHAEQKPAYEKTIRAMVAIALCRQAIRTPEACHGLDGCALKMMDRLRECPPDNVAYEPPRGKHASTAVAALLAMAEFEAAGGQLCSCEELVERTNAKIDAKDCRIVAAPTDLGKPEVMDIGWSQIKKLIAGCDRAGPLLKERKKKKLCASGVAFELTDAGRAAAKTALLATPARLGPLRELIGEADPALVGAMLAVDFREAGGGRHQLHDLANWLSTGKVPFVVRALPVADFAMFVSAPAWTGGATPALMAPLLIERKTYEDVALSLADTRCVRRVAARSHESRYVCE